MYPDLSKEGEEVPKEQNSLIQIQIPKVMSPFFYLGYRLGFLGVFERWAGNDLGLGSKRGWNRKNADEKTKTRMDM